MALAVNRADVRRFIIQIEPPDLIPWDGNEQILISTTHFP